MNTANAGTALSRESSHTASWDAAANSISWEYTSQITSDDVGNTLVVTFQPNDSNSTIVMGTPSISANGTKLAPSWSGSTTTLTKATFIVTSSMVGTLTLAGRSISAEGALEYTFYGEISVGVTTVSSSFGSCRQPPSQATAAGFGTCTFFDDFWDISKSIDLNNTQNRASGYLWTPSTLEGVMPSSWFSQPEKSVLRIAQGEENYNVALQAYGSAMDWGFHQQYGYWEFVARFANVTPKSMGWASLWTFSASHLDGSNNSRWGELDVMEALVGMGTTAPKMICTAHDHWGVSEAYGNGANNGGMTINDTTVWHKYGMLWTPGSIKWYLDDELSNSLTYGSSEVPCPNGNSNPLGTFSILDSDTMGNTLMLGAGTGENWLEVDSVTVWK